MHRWLTAIGLCAIPLASHLAPGQAQPAPPDDEIVATIIEGLHYREATVPPLTMCAVWRAFYTPVYWRWWRETMAPEVGPTETVESDRAAVAITLWESPDGDEYQREYQALYRGHNNFVDPRREGRPDDLADLYRLVRGTRTEVVSIDRLKGYPYVRVQPPEVVPPAILLGLPLALAGPGGWPLSKDLSSFVEEPTCRLGEVHEEDGVFTIRLGCYDPEQQYAQEEILDLDRERGFAPTRERHVRIMEGERAYVMESRWDGYKDLGESDPGADGPYLATTVTTWYLRYDASGAPPLERVEIFDCLALAPTMPGTPRPWLPLCAVLDEDIVGSTKSDLVETLYGWPLQVRARGFAEEAPPEPPADLLELSPAKKLDEILDRYALQPGAAAR